MEQGSLIMKVSGARIDPLTEESHLADRAFRHALVIGGGSIYAPLARQLTGLGIRTTCLLQQGAGGPELGPVEVMRGSLGRFRWRELEHDPPDVIFHLDSRGSSRNPLKRARNRFDNERLLL